MPAIQSNTMLYKTFPFQVLETKDKNTFNGKGDFGIIKGYASTYGNKDRVGDVVLEGAFDESVKCYKTKNRQIKVYYQHNSFDMPVGGILPENIESDKVGLPVTINMADTTLGTDCYKLVKQGILCDMSIGYTVDESSYDSEGTLLLKKLSLWEVSIVGEPANERAQITDVKSRNKHKFFTIDLIKNIVTKKDYEDALRESGAFSKEAATFLAARFIEKSRGEPETTLDLKTFNSHLAELKLLINQI
jgi:uncharacterized protein